MPGLDKKKLLKDIERDRRRKVRARVKELRGLIRQARAERRAAIRGVKLQCRAARQKLRTVCAMRAKRAREQGDAAVAARLGELGEQRETDRLIRDTDRRSQAGRRRSSSSERRAESDDEVRANIPRGLVSVFEAVRKHVKPHARKSRTESFLEWAEENPGEVYALQAEQAERELARLIAEQARTEKLARKRGKLTSEEVPF